MTSLPVRAIPGARPFAPRVSVFTARFWAALAAGRFETTRCPACARHAFPPRAFCPHCWRREVDWASLSGRGRLYAQTMIHAAPRPFAHLAPYRACIVDLDEGLRVLTWLRAEGAAPALDSGVRLVVLRFDDGPLFAAEPA